MDGRTEGQTDGLTDEKMARRTTGNRKSVIVGSS